MHIAKLSTNGQITVPAAIRRLLGVSPGDRVMFTQNPDGEVVIAKVTLTASEVRYFPGASFVADTETEAYGRILEELRSMGPASEREVTEDPESR